MNVASLSLCKELHKLSGWQSSRSYFGFGKEPPSLWVSGSHDEKEPFVCYAYDLDYLLLKLEDVAQTQRFGRFYLEYAASVKRPTWRWFASFNSEGFEISDASNPTDAVAKLCIELFKQGILLKESK